MKFRLVCSIFLCAILPSLRVSAIEYSGNNLLSILGKDKNSNEFREFSASWGLNAQCENNTRGIKVYVNTGTQRIEGILFAGENFTLNNSRFAKCTTQLPFGVSLDDNAVTLSAKLGAPVKLMETNVLHFVHQDVEVEVAYAGTGISNIYSVKYHAEPIAASIKNQPVEMAAMPGPTSKITSSRPTANTISGKLAGFKEAIMDVFKAYRESAFYNIKGRSRTQKNFWNYRYTYDSSLKIPGEKFSMLYSFPFTTSDLDYVSVLKEGDKFDKSFETTYHEFEKKLMESFPASDGWVASCIPNKESKNISDLELRNDRYGAIVLDYCRNPNGRHILYLRFLLFSN